MKITSEEFRILENKEGVLKVNYKKYGIPQGSGMSAVCSNVHLIHFDQELHKWASQHDALYRRYSDNLILVIPCNLSSLDYKEIKDEVLHIVSKYEKYGLEV